MRAHAQVCARKTSRKSLAHAAEIIPAQGCGCAFAPMRAAEITSLVRTSRLGQELLVRTSKYSVRTSKLLVRTSKNDAQTPRPVDFFTLIGELMK